MENARLQELVFVPCHLHAMTLSVAWPVTCGDKSGLSGLPGSQGTLPVLVRQNLAFPVTPATHRFPPM